MGKRKGANISSAFWFLRCVTDHNIDNTTEILREWLVATEKHYRHVKWRAVEEPR